jgi:hypothetical protein
MLFGWWWKGTQAGNKKRRGLAANSRLKQYEQFNVHVARVLMLIAQYFLLGEIQSGSFLDRMP